MPKRRAVTGEQGHDEIMTKQILGLGAVALVPIDASKSGWIDIQLSKVAFDVADDMVMMLAGEIGDLATRHGDRIAWSDDRVHNGPTVFYKLLKKPPCQAVFLCL